MVTVSYHPQAAFNDLVRYILGNNWYKGEPLETEQINAAALDEVYKKLSGWRWKLCKFILAL